MLHRSGNPTGRYRSLASREEEDTACLITLGRLTPPVVELWPMKRRGKEKKEKRRGKEKEKKERKRKKIEKKKEIICFINCDS
jgi:hypothetical protein